MKKHIIELLPLLARYLRPTIIAQNHSSLILTWHHFWLPILSLFPSTNFLTHLISLHLTK
jgi:hypothetical protein